MGPMQPELWKALAAMAPVILQRPLKEQRYIVWTCVHSPYAFSLARNQSDLEVYEGETVCNVICVNCFISNCFDGNDYNNKVVMIIKQPPYWMVPIKLEGQWFDDYALKILYELNGLISQPEIHCSSGFGNNCLDYHNCISPGFCCCPVKRHVYGLVCQSAVQEYLHISYYTWKL